MENQISVLTTMIAAGADTPEGKLRRRMDYMVAELERCQQASGDGYIGGGVFDVRLMRPAKP